MKVIFGKSAIWTADKESTVGSKVENFEVFKEELAELVDIHDTAQDRIKGQHFVVLPREYIVNSGISCGVGRRTDNPNDYVLREWRGSVGCYLKRDEALPIDFCAVIVYTMEAYENDPESEVFELDDLRAQGATHVLVALLASNNEVPNARSARALVAGIAGANNELLGLSAKDTEKLCIETTAYEKGWCVVAD